MKLFVFICILLSNLSLLANDFTVSCRIKTTETYTDNFHAIFSKAGSVNPWNGYQIGAYLNHIRVELNSQGFDGNIPINDGNWHTIKVLFNESKQDVEINVDGITDSVFPTRIAFINNPYPARKGIGRDGLNGFTGEIEDLSFSTNNFTAHKILNKEEHLFVKESNTNETIIMWGTVALVLLTSMLVAFEWKKIIPLFVWVKCRWHSLKSTRISIKFYKKK